MKKQQVEKIADALIGLKAAVGVGLGGSRGLGIADDNSDYDFVLFRLGADPIGAGVIGRVVEPCVDRIIYPEKGNFIQAEIDGEKIEIFQTDLSAIKHEIGMALQGKFRWSVRPLFSHGDLSTRLISHLVYLEILRDKNLQLKASRDKALPFPDLLKKSLIRFFFQQASFSKTHAAKVRSTKDFHYLMGLLSSFLFFLDIVVFALNDSYPVIEKGGERLISKLAVKPAAYDSMSRVIYELALANDHQALIRQMEIMLDSFEDKANIALACAG